MRTISRSIDIAAPPETVWGVMCDVERWHEWTESVSEIVRMDNADFGLGSRVTIKQPKLPKAVWAVTEFNSGKSFTWVNRGLGVSVSALHKLEPTMSGSKVILTIEYRGALAGLVAVMTKSITERYLSIEAAGLKARCGTKET